MYRLRLSTSRRSRAAAAAASSGDARYLAGGQSLIQAMKLRLSQAERLVDLGGIADLKGIKVDGSSVTIGAMTTHATVARIGRRAARRFPALAELAGGIGDPMVRNMGTIGGSIANADPAACYPAAVLGLGATIHTDQRSIAADSFFTGLYETALQPGELIIAVSFPIGAEGGLHQVQAAGLALRAGRRVRQPGRGRRARGGHRRQEQRVPRRRRSKRR